MEEEELQQLAIKKQPQLVFVSKLVEENKL